MQNTYVAVQNWYCYELRTTIIRPTHRNERKNVYFFTNVFRWNCIKKSWEKKIQYYKITILREQYYRKVFSINESDLW